MKMAARACLAMSALACGSASCTRPPAPERPNILLVTIDTWRADRLSPATTPRINELAQRGLRFTAARAVVPLTLPSHATILTGLLPTVTGVRENGTSVLRDDQATVARLLKSAGYRTAAFVGAFVLDHRFGLSSGFDTYDDRIPRSATASERLEAERPASAVVDSALAWLAQSTTEAATSERSTPTPFFMWVHLYDPHAPYEPPASFVKATGRPVAAERYDGEVAYTDSQVARLFDALRERHLEGQTLIIVAGDHGEGLDDHGERTHGMLLYDSTLRVPLVVAGPGVTAANRDGPVSLVDVAPTILGAAGVTPSSSLPGTNLLASPSKNLAARTDARDIYAETDYPRVAGWSSLQALTDGRWKAIRAGSETEMYDVLNDRAEEHNLAATQPAMVNAMRSRLDQIRATARQSTERIVSAEAQERLRALGYVASSGAPASSDRTVNPSSTTQAWTAFEDALTALNEHRPGALPALSALAAAHPDAPVFQTTYARAVKESGRAKDALVVYRRSAKRWPTDAALLHDLAVAARETAGRSGSAEAATLREEAMNAERAALALQPQSAIARNGLGLLAVDAQRPADAAREFEQAAALDPGNASYWTNLGNARRALGDAASAEAAYKRALDADPDAADAANGLGVLLVEARRPSEAARWFDRALRSAPDFVEARLNLGIALQESGDSGRAADAFRGVIAAAGEHPREKDAARKLLASMAAHK
ncbi:MAG TPA: sulfatase-like hydrolase/transferase [Vicinamibacterales bacterium]|jgi:arylsulfatase A-like enzyme/Tfp pilus assembly protein PilF